MNTRERIALAWPPMLLRAALAVTFIWAGAGKVFHYEPLSDGEAVALGLSRGSEPEKARTTGPAKNTGQPADAPQTAPAAPIPSGERPSKPGDKATPGQKTAKPPSKKEPAKPTVSKTGGLVNRDEPDVDAGAEEGLLNPALRNPEPPVAAAPATQPIREAGDPSQVRGLYKLALAINAAGVAGQTNDGKPTMALVPGALAGGAWPVRLAWGVATIELVGGVMLLAGMLTRFWAVLLAGVMAGALWLVDIGPAMQSGQAVLGFLPNHPAFSVTDWQGPLWRFGLLCMAFALVFAGPGLLALDNALFGAGTPKPSGGEPKPKAG